MWPQGSWSSALQAQLRRQDTDRSDLRRSRRLMRVYQRRLGRFEHAFRQVGVGISWPLVAVAGVLGYALGQALR
jgi:membrane-bound lytic murein transglycosylase MltF